MARITARIAGWGKYLPPGVFDNAELLATCGVLDAATGQRVFNYYGPDGRVVKQKALTVADILKTTGIEVRRRVTNGDWPDELALRAAADALRRARVPADMPWRGIFVHTVHRRIRYPTIAQRIQHAHGLRVVDGYAEDCSSACAGYVQQLQKIHDLIQVRPGAYLAVGADTMSRLTPPDDVNHDLFGDAAGASVWIPGEPGGAGTIVATRSALITQGENGDVHPIEFIREDPRGYMLMPYGPLVVKFVRKHVFRLIRQLLEDADWREGPPLVLILHQANANMTKFFPELVRRVYRGEILTYTGIRRIGNASSGSTAYGLAECLDGPDPETGNTIHIQPGYRVVLVGFGSGMNIHGVALQF